MSKELTKFKPSNKLKKVANKYRTQLITKQTKPESIFQKILDKLGIKYIFQFVIFPSKNFFILDFFVPDSKVVFEIDGKQHYTKKGKEKDKIRTDKLNEIGLQVERFKNRDLYHSPKKQEKRIRKILNL